MGYLVAATPAVATGRRLDVRHALAPALVGSITPDVIDKSLEAMQLTAYSRALGHSFLFVALLLVGWALLRHFDRGAARPFGWWTAGIVSHIVADLANDVFRSFEGRSNLFAGWPFWPITDRSQLQLSYEISEKMQIHPYFTALEIGVFTAAAMVFTLSVVQWFRR